MTSFRRTTICGFLPDFVQLILFASFEIAGTFGIVHRAGATAETVTFLCEWCDLSLSWKGVESASSRLKPLSRAISGGRSCLIRFSPYPSKFGQFTLSFRPKPFPFFSLALSLSLFLRPLLSLWSTSPTECSPRQTRLGQFSTPAALTPLTSPGLTSSPLSPMVPSSPTTLETCKPLPPLSPFLFFC